MSYLPVRIKNISNNPLPGYATSGSAGLDIRAYLESPVIIKPLERVLVPTGLFLEIPPGWEAQVRPRSGLAIKQGLTCLNSPGTIDSDYRGEIKVILVNLDSIEHFIHSGDRVAQLVFQEVKQVEWIVVDALEESSRGEGGFGHTGKH
jgi:dUTP pyrophosphatase